MLDYQFILFDLDGTLTDSRLGIVRSINYALAQFGLNAKTDLNRFIGPPLYDSFRRYCSLNNQEAKKAVEHCREYYAQQGIYENSVYEGIPELLGDLRNDGKIIVLATSKPTLYAKKILHHFNLLEKFALVVGSSMDRTGSGKAEILNHIKAQLSPAFLGDAVMVGDRKYDVAGARAHGIESIAVTYGYGTLHELQQAMPTHLVHSVDELRGILV